MTLGDLNTEQGIAALDAYLSERSYIEGYQPSQADIAVLEALNKLTVIKPHIIRWINHIKSFDAKSLPGKKTASFLEATPEAKKTDNDDDIDLFGSDEEDDAEAAQIREERLKAYAEKKSKKAPIIAKSSIVIDVKPWDDETDMGKMEEVVRSIVLDGLVWGASKLVPVGYGIKKLQIMCVVEDDKVSVDGLVEQIQEFEELVQSVDIAAFNKI